MVQIRHLRVSVLFLLLSTLLILSCGSSGHSISSAPDQAQQEVPEDTTETETVEANSEEEQALEEKQKLMEQAYRDELEERYQGRANSITTYYNNAQRLFFMQNYQAALYHINKAAEIRETSDILALRGSIYLALGSKQRFAENWRLALEMDENVPIPNVGFVINELKALGLINQNYKPGN
jgi:tetratricopeptide (TPR) repeat protein